MKRFVRLFKPQFAGLVESGVKLQTVRPRPKRMPRPGDRISLRTWTGKPYRSRQRVLREAIITKIESFALDGNPRDWGFILDGRRLNVEEWTAFIRADGFLCATDFVSWFDAEHGLPFEGIVIHWQNLREHAPGEAGSEGMNRTNRTYWTYGAGETTT